MLSAQVDEREHQPADMIARNVAKLEHIFSEIHGFKQTELSKKIFPSIAEHWSGLSNKNDYDPLKCGLAMVGKTGTGKTVLLKFAAILFDADYLDVPSLSIEFSKAGPTGFWNMVEPSNKCMDVILDDLGAEQNSSNYGNSLPIVDLIYHRYNLWQRNGARLWLSSNLSSAELSNRYGERVVDRIREMCCVIPAVGEQFRK